MSICTVYIRVTPNSPTPVLLLSNRDEFDTRSTEPLHMWSEAAVVAGRDLKGGGTWLGVNPKNGRFAAVLNVREGGRKPPEQARTRGDLVTGFLRSPKSALDWVAGLNPEQYDGFNLILGDKSEVYLFSNRGSGLAKLGGRALLDQPKLRSLVDMACFGESSFYELTAGSYALSNGVLQGAEEFKQSNHAGTLHPSWPKCAWVKQAADRIGFGDTLKPLRSHKPVLSQLAHTQAHPSTTASTHDLVAQALAVLSNSARAPDEELPDTGVPKLLERRLSSLFVRTLGYGTQTSSVLMLNQQGWAFAERTHSTKEQVSLSSLYGADELE